MCNSNDIANIRSEATWSNGDKHCCEDNNAANVREHRDPPFFDKADLADEQKRAQPVYRFLQEGSTNVNIIYRWNYVKA